MPMLKEGEPLPIGPTPTLPGARAIWGWRAQSLPYQFTIFKEERLTLLAAAEQAARELDAALAHCRIAGADYYDLPSLEQGDSGAPRYRSITILSRERQMGGKLSRYWGMGVQAVGSAKTYPAASAR